MEARKDGSYAATNLPARACDGDELSGLKISVD